MKNQKTYTRLHKVASCFLFIGALTNILDTWGLFSYSRVPSDVFIIHYPHFILKGLQIIGIWGGSILFIIYLLLLLFNSIHQKKI